MRLFIPSVVVRCGLTALALLLFAACQSDEEKLAAFRERGAAYVEEDKIEEAVIEFKNVLKIDPNDAAAHHELAKAFIKLRQPREAFWELSETVRLDPSNKEARKTLAGFLLVAGDMEEMLAHAETLIEIDPDDADSYVLKGQALVRLDRMEEAETAYLKAIELDPEQGPSYGLLANLYVRMNKPEAAEAALVNFTEISPGYRAYTALARFLLRRGNRPDDAVEALKKALSLAERAEEKVTARQNLARFYLRHEQVDEAVVVLEDGIAEAEQGSDAKLDLIYALARVHRSQGDVEKADALVESAVSAQPDNVRPYLSLSAYRSGQGDQKGALQAVEDALRVDPESSSAILRKAELLAELGFREKDKAQVAEARSLVEQVLELEPSNPEANFVGGKIRLAEGDREEAEALLRIAVDGRPDWAQARFVLGSALMIQGKNASARAELARAVELDPGLDEARRVLAQLHSALGEHEYSIEQAREYLIQHPENTETRILLAQGLVRLGRREEAIQELERVPEGDRGADVLFALGRLYAGSTNFEKAQKLLLGANQLNPNHPEILGSLMRVENRLGKIEESNARIEAAVKAEPDNARLVLLKGESALVARDSEAAEASFKRAIELDPNLIAAYQRLASLYQAMGRLDETIATYEAALVASPNSPQLNQFMAVLYELSGNKDSAVQHYEKAIDLDPSLGEAKNNLAYLLAEEGRDLDRALDLAQDAKALMPESPNAADTLGWVLFKRGMSSAAIGYLKEAVANTPADASSLGVIQHHLAQAYAADKQNDKAIETLEALLSEVESRMEEIRQRGGTPEEPEWSVEARSMLARLKSAG